MSRSYREDHEKGHGGNSERFTPSGLALTYLESGGIPDTSRPGYHDLKAQVRLLPDGNGGWKQATGK